MRCFFFFQSYVTCSVGVGKVGVVTLPYGVVTPILSITWALLVKRTGRLPVFLFGEYSRVSYLMHTLYICYTLENLASDQLLVMRDQAPKSCLARSNMQ